MTEASFQTISDPCSKEEMATMVTLRRLRNMGWRVAVHNDYNQGGEFHTFWLFTHTSGRFVKGEGKSDHEAVSRAATQAFALGMPFPPAPHDP